MKPLDTSQEMIRLIKGTFERNRNRVFVVDSLGGAEYTYGEIEDLSLRAAGMLRELGLSKGDRISIILPNCIEYIILYFACMHAGVIPAPINQRLHVNEMKYIVSTVGARCIFVSSAFSEVIGQLESPELRIIPLAPKCEKRSETAGDWLKTIESHVQLPDGPFNCIKDKDTIIIVFTSGTTNRPKGVEIGYKQICGNGKMFANMLKLEPRHRFIAYLDLAYLGGFYNLMLIPFLAQGSIVLQEAFSPRTALGFWNTVIENKVNAIWLVPSIASILLSIDRASKGSEYSSKNIDRVLIGTAPLPDRLKKEFEKRYHVTLYENYGLSETFFIASNYPGIGETKGVGKLVPNCSVKIVDDTGSECRTGERGEVLVLSPYLMKGYYKATDDGTITKDGWLRTGDIGYFDQDKYLFITDRKKDLIIRGGINISPKEIEEVILRYPSISDVAVIGVPDKYAGEIVVAIVNGAPGLDRTGILNHCKANLAQFKIPENFFSSDNMPRSVTGKIQKKELRRLVQEGKLPELPSRSNAKTKRKASKEVRPKNE